MASGGGDDDLNLTVLNWLLTVPDMNMVQNMDDDWVWTVPDMNMVQNIDTENELETEEGQVMDADDDTPPPPPPPPPPAVAHTSATSPPPPPAVSHTPATPPPPPINDNGEDGDDDDVSDFSLGTTEVMSESSDDTLLLDVYYLELLCAQYDGREG